MKMSAAEPPSIPLAQPMIGERERELVNQVLDSGRLSLGPMQDRFEAAFAEWLGVKEAVAVSSGTAALHLGVRAQGWGPGDAVITSPLSFVASVNCLLYEGVRPVLCDVEAESANLDPEAAAAAIGPETRGILPVHIFGFPAAMPAFEELAKRHGLGLLEDACEALGARDSAGRRIGSGDATATFAFYANKQLTTGEGGMLTTGDPELAAQVRSERNQGRGADMGWLDHQRLGYNYRLSELAAALGVAQMERLGAMLAGRDRVAELYREGLEDLDQVELPVWERGEERRSWFVYVIRLAEADGGTDPVAANRAALARRNQVIERLAVAGIPAKAYMPCLHTLEHLQPFGYREGDFPVAESISARSLALPFFPEMSEEQVEQVCGQLRRVLADPVDPR